MWTREGRLWRGVDAEWKEMAQSVHPISYNFKPEDRLQWALCRVTKTWREKSSLSGLKKQSTKFEATHLLKYLPNPWICIGGQTAVNPVKDIRTVIWTTSQDTEFIFWIQQKLIAYLTKQNRNSLWRNMTKSKVFTTQRAQWPGYDPKYWTLKKKKRKMQAIFRRKDNQ